MNIKILEPYFVVCKLDNVNEISIHDEYCFISKYDDKISLICTQRYIPNKVLAVYKGYKGIQYSNNIDSIGIGPKINALLVLNDINIIIVSSYESQFIFIKENKFAKAVEILTANNFTIVEEIK